jgi:hypothetical protein
METTEMEYKGEIYQRYTNTSTGEDIRWKTGNVKVYDKLPSGWVEWKLSGRWNTLKWGPCEEPEIEKQYQTTNIMNNFKESIEKLNLLKDLTTKHIEQMEQDYLKHYMVSNGLKLGDIIQYMGFVQYEGNNVTKYAVVTNVECEYINDRKWDDPNKTDMDNSFYVHMDSYDLSNSGVSKRNNHYRIDDCKVLCSQDRLKEICNEMGIKYELNRKTLKKIADVTIESL